MAARMVSASATGVAGNISSARARRAGIGKKDAALIRAIIRVVDILAIIPICNLLGQAPYDIKASCCFGAQRLGKHLVRVTGCCDQVVRGVLRSSCCCIFGQAASDLVQDFDTKTDVQALNFAEAQVFRNKAGRSLYEIRDFFCCRIGVGSRQLGSHRRNKDSCAALPAALLASSGPRYEDRILSIENCANWEAEIRLSSEW